jgi:signal transduction histidine kinase
MNELLPAIAGDSETGRLINSIDWSTTFLGPAADWPQSLKTSLSICLACRFPILLWWGPEMVLLYNDDYAVILGAKHPRAMGGIGREVWSDVWQVVGPMLEEVRRTAKAAKADDLLLIMNRHGYDEETYFSFSYSPIVDESGGVGGIFTPVLETTDKVIAPRRFETLRQLAAQPRSDGLPAACKAVAEVLADNPCDLPFGLIYTFDANGEHANLAASFGLEQFPAMATQRVGLREAGDCWQLGKAFASGQAQRIGDLPSRFSKVPQGMWSSPVRDAMVLPIAVTGSDRSVAVLVAAVSPHRPLDESYASFFDLLAGGLASAITDALAYEAERKRAEALAEIDRAKTAFFSNISHEFRTPLTLMLGPLEELVADERLPAQAKAEVLLLQRNSLRLLKLVNALLDFSRIEAGRMEASFAPVDLAEFTADLAGVFRSAIEKAGLRYRVECATPQQKVYIDSAMWEKIVLNLLSNALKFTFEGEIGITLVDEGSRVVLTVADTGVGIEAQHVPRLLERFYRVEGTRARTHEGSGIGLALVHDLVKLHMGEIEVRSEAGRGTSVIVRIPTGKEHLPRELLADRKVERQNGYYARAHIEEVMQWVGTEPFDQVPAPLLAAADGSDARPESSRVLIVDDNADMRDYLCRLLSSNWEVRATANGMAALAVAHSWRPDIIIADVMMPQMDGFELLKRWRANEDTRDIPFIMLSARAGEEARIEGMSAGADEYLVKPFSSRELTARIESLVLHARTRQVERRHARRMETIFEQAPVGIAILRGEQHVFELANPVYLELIGNRAITGKPIREALPELASQGIFELLDTVYRTGVPHIGHAQLVELARGPSGRLEECFFDFVYQPIVSAQGTVEDIAVVVFEVTELNQARRDAEVASLAKDEFMAMLGHELRNPLAPIMTALQLMRLRDVHAFERERMVIERQAQHLVRLVDDLLDVSRIAQGKVQLHRQRTELAPIVARAIETVSPLLEERSHIIDVDVVAHGLMVDADPERLAQVFSNLLTNAAKYTDKAGRIAVTAKCDAADIVVEVSDNGNGIAPELLSNIFDVFVQGRQTLDRSRGGLGLGLTIVRSLTVLHGGRVEVKSEGVGRGSTFIVRLPSARTLGATGTPGANDANGASQAGRTGYPILVVDDNEDAARMLADLLALHGHVVRTVSNAATALQVVEHFTPSLAFLDIGLPGMDGYELARRLKQTPGLQALKLVAVTGYGQESDRERSRHAGFELHLVKPLNVDTLAGLIRAVMEGRSN